MVVLTGVAVGLLAPTGGTSRSNPPTVRPASEDGPDANLSVAIEPNSWWLEEGANVSLAATWVGIPAGCALEPLWFRWTVNPGTAEGTLGTVNASSTVFYASGDGSGASSVVVRSAANVDCRGNESATVSHAIATVTVAAALTVTDLAFSLDPIAPGSAAELTGTVEGGNPPYRVRVRWNDGSVSGANVSSPGPFSIDHTYTAVGAFDPALLATDAAGRMASAHPDEPLYVSTSFAVAIVASAPVAEVGVPATFGIVTTDAPANFSWLFACDDAVPVSPGNATGLAYGCSFEAPGVTTVYFEAVGADLPFPVASASLEEPVVPAPSVTLVPPFPTGEVNGTVCAAVELSGGVPPLTVTWSLVGAGTGGTEAVASDGIAYLPLTSPNAGTLVLSVVATDQLGVASASVQQNVDFVPRLAVEAAIASVVTSGSAEVNVSASAIQGAPPLVWAVVPGTATDNGSEFAGALPDGGAFSWNGTYRAGGTLSATVVVVDAVGVFAVVNLTVSLLPSGASGPSVSDGGSDVLFVVLAVLALAAAAFLFRRGARKPAAPTRPPDPVNVLREAIEPSDGVDRGLVELLAEERGVPLEVVRATLERLKVDGTVRAGRGADGEEVLAWSSPYER